MIQVRRIMVGGSPYDVTISDEQGALSAAYAAGGAVLGLWDGKLTGGLWLCEYVVESLGDVDEELLMRVVCRRFRLPWLIGETKRLLIREFIPEDAGKMRQEKLTPLDGIFYDEKALARYVNSQYRFFEYGIWAVVEKESQTIIGRAGLSQSDWGEEEGETKECGKEEGETKEVVMEEGQTKEVVMEEGGGGDVPLELGYHVFSPWRRCGYGEEACREIMSYAARRITGRLHAVIDGENEASRRLAKALGFRLTAERCSGLAGRRSLYVWNYPELPKRDF